MHTLILLYKKRVASAQNNKNILTTVYRFDKMKSSDNFKKVRGDFNEIYGYWRKN
jgi:hypothetical protein